jgi:hypothetical protein
MRSLVQRRIIERERNIVRVDFSREPDPPAPRFPGAGAMRAWMAKESGDVSVAACADRVNVRTGLSPAR